MRGVDVYEKDAGVVSRAVDDRPRRHRAARATVALLVVACFGPYVAGGLRTEQLVAYTFPVLMFFALTWTWVRARPTMLVVGLGATWILYAVTAILGATGTPPPSQWAPGSLLSGIDNLVLPLAVLALTIMLTTPDNRGPLLRTATRVLAVAAAANGMLALVMTRVDLSLYLARFWGAPTDDTSAPSVAQLAATLGRYSGVFNQPAEAGLMYGLAGLGAVHAFKDKPRTMFLLLAPIFAGGLLSVSKVFILGGAPLILWQVWRNRRGRVGAALVGAAGVGLLVQSGALAKWSGADYLGRLVRPDGGSYLRFYSAGRFGQRSTLQGVVDEVMAHAPITGFGAQGLRVSYDNGWVEALIVAGWVGAVLYTLALLLILRIPTHAPEKRLAWGVAILAAFASLGLPALTANRSGVLLWLLVGILAAPTKRPEDLLAGPRPSLADVEAGPRATVDAAVGGGGAAGNRHGRGA